MHLIDILFKKEEFKFGQIKWKVTSCDNGSMILQAIESTRIFEAFIDNLGRLLYKKCIPTVVVYQSHQ